MSASMVDLVAQALCANAQGYVDAKWYDYTPAARAAIEAMRTPTDAMVDAGADVHLAECWPGAPDVWQAMISAALESE